MGGFVSRGSSAGAEAGPSRPPGCPRASTPNPGFPVLTAGPTPRIGLADWRLKVEGLVASPRGVDLGEIMRTPVQLRGRHPA